MAPLTICCHESSLDVFLTVRYLKVVMTGLLLAERPSLRSLKIHATQVRKYLADSRFYRNWLKSCNYIYF